MERPRRINSFQALRAIFVALIFLSHCPGDGATLLPQGGDAGVSFFFVLSGFVLAYSGRDSVPRFGSFMRSRLRRILPAYLIALVAAYPVMSWNFSTANLLPLLTLTQSWWPDPAIYFGGDSPSWFLSDLIFFYLLFPLLFKAVRSVRPRTAMLTVAALYVAEIVALLSVGDVPGIPWSLYVFPPARLLDFLTGIVAARLFYRESSLRINGGKAAALQIFTIVLVAGAIAAAEYLPERFTLSALYLPVSATVIFVWALTDSARTPLNRVADSRLPQAFGAFSLEFYLLHVPVLVLAKHFISDHAAIAVTAFAVTTIAAMLMHRIIARLTRR